jgi:cytochrome c oxidase assembly protein subunit 15
VLTVQFDHRMVAYLVAAAALAQGWLAWRSGDLVIRFSAMLLLSVVLCQIALGILTLLSEVQIGLALAHQAGGLTVFALALRHLFLARHN